MIDYFLNYHHKLLGALLEHLELVFVSLFCSLLLAALLTAFSMYSKTVSGLLIHLFSMIYSIPSLAMFAILIPLTGLGRTTAVIVLTIYNQYLLLRNFVAGLTGVDAAIVEAAAGMGMTTMQTLLRIRLPLAKGALITGIRLSAVSTVGIGMIAAQVNAGGLGTVLFDGLRTMNFYKIIWGSILSAGMAIMLDLCLRRTNNNSDKVSGPP
ncbi:MAG: ABC transporter permease [Lachnospiraceae bacterium]